MWRSKAFAAQSNPIQFLTHQWKDELRKAFEDSVEDYLAFCKERGEEFVGKVIYLRCPTK